MNKDKKLNLAIIFNILIVLLEIIGQTLSIRNHGIKIFMYYTENSNLLCLVVTVVYLVYLFRMKRGQITEIPGLLRCARMTFLTGLILTFLVVIFVLGPMVGGINGMCYVLFYDSMLFEHTLCPILSFISYYFFEKEFCRFDRKFIKCPVIITLIYAAVLILLNLLRVAEGPYPFLKVYEQQWWASVLWFVVIVGLISYISAKLFEVSNPQLRIKIRHRVFWVVARLPFAIISYLLYHVHIRFCRDKRPLLILANHQTPFDQFFVGLSFKGPLYYLATEDIFSNGLSSKLIKLIVDPVPIQKGTLDINAVKSCIKIAREGGSIVIFPEGNRTYSGQTENMKSSIVKLVKMLGLPIAFYRIEDGYGIDPRWSDTIRKGSMRAGVSRILEPEEYGDLDNEALFEIIKTELMVDDNRTHSSFSSHKMAEHLERVMYICPQCKFTRFESKGNYVKCTGCNREYKYTENLRLSGVNFDNPLDTIKKWIIFQEAYVNSSDISLFHDSPLYEDTVMISRVIPNKKKMILEENSTLYLFGNRIKTVIDKELMDYSFDEISSMVVLGHNKLNVTMDNLTYQIKGDKSFNAVKYVNFYYHYKNVKEGKNDKFLGF